ncbi:hypothetical protein ZWY2020_058160 [Hordeum vulgare]|nr:hypothetical protein ZWY2020_058160 [Hordeum vulgare]
MDVPWLLVAHGAVTALVVVSFLCGQWPIFEAPSFRHQPLPHLRRLPPLSVRAPRLLPFPHVASPLLLLLLSEELFAQAARAGGVRYRSQGSRARRRAVLLPPNPILQVFYVAIIGGTYFIIVQSSFKYIPGDLALAGTLSIVVVSIGAILFVLTSFSDPGTVTSENVSHYVSAYPFDNIIYVEKECSTCKITRHFLLCLYGAIILGFIVAGELKDKKVVYILTVYYGIDNSFSGLFPHVAQWLLAVHNTQILLAVFLGIIALLLGGFCAYHVHLCLSTRLQARKAASYIHTEASINAGSSEAQKSPPSKWKTFFSRSGTRAKEPVVKNNIYDVGWIRNLCEVMVPLSERRSFSSKKSE